VALLYRSKEVLTVLSRIRVRRAYYHCTSCQEGVIPKDFDLDVVGTSSGYSLVFVLR